MSRLVIGNRLPGPLAHRLVWLARAGDVVVLPSHPRGEFLERLRRFAALPAGEPAIAVPPAGRAGAGRLDDDRLAVPGFVGELRALAGARGVDRILPVRSDAAIRRLACAAGLDRSRAAADPAGRDGGLVDTLLADTPLVDSLRVDTLARFRAVAAGNRVPIPEGRVCTSPREAEEFVWRLLCGGRSALVRPEPDPDSGGSGGKSGSAGIRGGIGGGGELNELIVPVGGRPGADAETTVAVGDRETLGEYLAKNWRRYSGGTGRPVVVEHYIHDCGRLRLEYQVSDDEAKLLFHGYARTASADAALVLPTPAERVPDVAGLLAEAAQVMEAVRGLGHRGHAALDAVVTPSGRVLFTGLREGLSAATHLDAAARLAVGDGYLCTRVLIARDRIAWSSYTAAEALLERRGLAFDPGTRTGVLLTGDDFSGDDFSGDAFGGADGDGRGGAYSADGTESTATASRAGAGVESASAGVPTGQFLAIGRDQAHAAELEAAALAAFEAALAWDLEPDDSPAASVTSRSG
ncbi:MAG: hypothetical protein HOV87_13955 [Catenulispora sp.]|nr:hypothetical protein [Catenulispora sp.]